MPTKIKKIEPLKSESKEKVAQKNNSEAVNSTNPESLLKTLANIHRFYGEKISSHDLKAMDPLHQKSFSMFNFSNLAEKLGYVIRRKKLSEDYLKKTNFPFLCITKNGEALLFTNRKNNRFFYTNEKDSPLAMTKKELIEKGSEVYSIHKKIRVNTFWRSKVFEAFKGVLYELILSSMLINIFALVTPLFSMTVYNKIIGQRALDTLAVLAIGVITIYFFESLIRGLRGYISAHSGARINVLIASQAVKKILWLPYRYFEETSSGQITERLRQLDVIKQFFTGQMPLLIVDMAFVFVFIAALFVLNSYFGWVALLSIPIFILVSYISETKQKKYVEQNFAARIAQSSLLNETLGSTSTIKTLGLEPEIEKRWGNRLALAAWTEFRLHNMNNVSSIVSTFLQHMISLGIIVIGATAVISGDLSIGALVAAGILINRVITPMRQITSAWGQLHEVISAFQKLDELFKREEEKPPHKAINFENMKGEVEFKNVTYQYKQDYPKVINDLNLKIKPGSIFAIIGPSGSGKTTLLKMIQGLYTPNSGQVLIDGLNLVHYSPSVLRRRIGSMPSESHLFDGTVIENITFGSEVEKPEQVIGVSKFVGAHDFIQNLPEGYQTMIGQSGVGLSSGQKQMICIARALIRNPKLILLDEATNALDPVKEHILFQKLKETIKNRTIIVVTHRLGPLVYADEVALMIDGKIKHQGPPTKILPIAQKEMDPHQELKQS